MALDLGMGIICAKPADATVHAVGTILGVATAILLAYAYRKMKAGGLSTFTRFVVFGVAMLSLAQVLETAAAFSPEYFAAFPQALQLVSLAGFLCLGFGAWELYQHARREENAG
ncbi:MAG: hypothetical protein WC792_00010 [Candidatus Micrarchaeia archaeon]|jgi:hypothetical protein